MFFQLLFIHLYRPFLKYNRTTSPLPSHISPRKFCTQAAGVISKLLRLYKRTYGLRQICNIAVYIAHSACTIHLLNLPDKNAKRDVVHGVKHLEEIGESWTCARRTLRILSLSAERWKTTLPEEAAAIFFRTHAKWGMSEPATSPGSLSDLESQSQSTVPHMPQVNNNDDWSHNPRQQQSTQILPPNHHNGISAQVVQSPVGSTPDETTSSGGLSLPPQSAADLARGTTRNRPSIYLTKAQQDAWNIHQAARASSAADGRGSGAPPSATDVNAAVLFGGVDSLVEESQDWWLKDQSALALGFDNWVDPGSDWASLGISTAGGNNKGFVYNDRPQNGSVHHDSTRGINRTGATVNLQQGDSFEEEYF